MYFYRGMPDMYVYQSKGLNSYWVFWNPDNEEFVIHDRCWVSKGLPQSEEFHYFDTTDEVLDAMMEIAPWRDWKRHSTMDLVFDDIQKFGEKLGHDQGRIDTEKRKFKEEHPELV